MFFIISVSLLGITINLHLPPSFPSSLRASMAGGGGEEGFRGGWGGGGEEEGFRGGWEGEGVRGGWEGEGIRGGWEGEPSLLQPTSRTGVFGWGSEPYCNVVVVIVVAFWVCFIT